MRIIHLGTLLAVLAVAVTSGACATKRPLCTAYHFGASFPAAYEESARKAVAKWTAFSGDTVTIEEGDPNDDVCAFRSIASDSVEYAAKRDLMGTDFFAYHDPDTGSVTLAEGQWLSDEWCTDDRAACATSILMHETAHEYGLEHIADPAAVMGTTNPIPRTDYNASDRVELLAALSRS